MNSRSAHQSQTNYKPLPLNAWRSSRKRYTGSLPPGPRFGRRSGAIFSSRGKATSVTLACLSRQKPNALYERQLV